MGLTTVPDDWTSGYVELCVRWPDSEQWRAILRGQLAEAINEDFYDPFTGDPTEAITTASETLEHNMSLQECIVIPTGSIMAFGGDTAPSGWMLCDGSAISRATYATLFAAIGTAWGIGNGSTTFNIPNLEGKVIVMEDPEDEALGVVGESSGEQTHTLTSNEMPTHTHTQASHNHTQAAHNHTAQGSTETANSPTPTTRLLAVGSNNIFKNTVTGLTNMESIWNLPTTAVNVAATATNENTGSSAAHNNLQPYAIAQYMIKV